MRAARRAVGGSAIEAIIATYAGPRFGFVSKNFYPEFLAALDVLMPLLRTQVSEFELRHIQRGEPDTVEIPVPVSPVNPPLPEPAPESGIAQPEPPDTPFPSSEIGTEHAEPAPEGEQPEVPFEREPGSDLAPHPTPEETDNQVFDRRGGEATPVPVRDETPAGM
ncbi:MAG TPA: hypothetical protein VMD08_05680 [Candidatus Baltobacteraceae bacterium]|nr:hypothetical protein [Candidatus Baltobacteraceae bacterium]